MYSILILAKNSQFNFLPVELLFHIISFNEKDAVDLIQKKVKMMLKNKIKYFESMILFAFDSGLNISLNKCKLFYNNRIISKEEVVKTSNQCDCCERHKINRPKKLAPFVDTEFHGTFRTRCKCHCRQLSRFICREIM